VRELERLLLKTLSRLPVAHRGQPRLVLRLLAAVREPVWQLRSRTSGLRNPREKVLFERLRDVGAMSAQRGAA
jgi:hypothetical protein